MTRISSAQKKNYLENMNTGINAINEAVKEASAFTHPLFNELGKVIVGQQYLTERLVIGLLANGHVLLEGVPGLAKTLAVKSLANCLHVKFSRLQFTPDMLPADVVGTQIYNPQSGGFTTRKGPVFANLVLADEINRAPAKVQSALLEAMQEKQVTIGDQTYKLEEPFLVLATQNPIEQEGTYPLPEAQVDRFMLKLKIGYPTRAEERQILEVMAKTSGTPTCSAVVDAGADPQGPRSHQRHLRGRQGEGLHRGPRLRHARPGPLQDRGEGFHPARRVAARDHRAHAGGQGLRVPERPRLRHAAGREEHRHGRAAPPRGHHLRGRGRGKNQRNRSSRKFLMNCRCRDVGVGGDLISFTQGSSSVATLGYVPESRWDSRMDAKFVCADSSFCIQNSTFP
jgi:hypothetical protein